MCRIQTFFLPDQFAEEGDYRVWCSAFQNREGDAALALGPVGTGVASAAGGWSPPDAINMCTPGSQRWIGDQIEGVLPPGQAGMSVKLIINVGSHDAGAAFKH